jgi:hypothetical protein
MITSPRPRAAVRRFTVLCGLILIAGCGDVAAPPTSPALSEDDAIREAVFRHLFLHNASAMQQSAGAYFLAVAAPEDSTNGRLTDPSQSLLLHFVSHTPPVRPWSACTAGPGDGFFDTGTRARGLIFCAKPVQRITVDSAVVVGEYYEGTMSAAGKTIMLRRVAGKWIVVRDQPGWII